MASTRVGIKVKGVIEKFEGSGSDEGDKAEEEGDDIHIAKGKEEISSKREKD